MKKGLPGKKASLLALTASILLTLPAIAESIPSTTVPKPTTTPALPIPTDPAIPTTPITPETTTPTTPEAKTPGTIVDIAASNESFKTLVTAVKAAGLTEVLSSQGPFTVFAPTDKAFEALPEGTLEKLLKPENKNKLQQLLAYHVVPAAVESTAIKSGRVKTVSGKFITLSKTKNFVKVNNAEVITADIKASNGVIHVVDKVILPPDFKI
jgi:uncharacterized surface protein with fasciclin (FAS1) repeats